MQLARFLTTFLITIFSINTYSQELIVSDTLLISKIDIVGNKITKEKIIKRELLFKEGRYIREKDIPELITRSKENLLNTSLFNFVTIQYKINDSEIEINIDVQERWYIWPYPVLEHADRNLSSFIRNQEWSRVDYGLYVLINNFRGRKEILKLKTIFGYNNSFILYYNKPFIDKKQKIGMGLDFVYFRNHELPYLVSYDNLQYLKLTDQYLRKTFKVSSFLTYRPYVYSTYLLNFKYTDAAVHDSIVFLNNDYFYNGLKETKFISLACNFNFDKRDSKVYPLYGLRFYLSAVKNGLGILSEKGNFYIESILEDNYKLSDKLYFNTGVLGHINLYNINSFYFSEAIGYDNYIRGMEYYVTHGMDYYMSKSNLKYEIIPQTKLNLNFIPSDKFSKAYYALYFNIFFDTGYVDSQWNLNNSLTNEFLYSGGIGIDLVTYYDKVIRIEYSLNKFGEHGIFFHLGAPIIED